MSRSAQPYKLCQACFPRQGGGPELEVVEGGLCFVCQGLLDTLPDFAKKAVAAARSYEFDTFAVGVSLPDGVQEREDELRSDLRLKGNETIKTQASRLISLEVGAKLGKKMDRLRPDLTLLARLGDGTVSVTARPAYYYGRYSKPRGLPQRRELCEHCHGPGCDRCKHTGYARKQSVEALIRTKLAAFTRSDRATFTWMGSEDRESRVLPPGRPFVVEVKSPVKRRIPRKFSAKSRRGNVSVSSGRMLPGKPVRLPKFKFKTVIQATAAKKPKPEDLAEVRAQFRRREVRFERPHDKPATKMVYQAYATANGRKLEIEAVLDGGLPVKRFVNGDLVTPSVSEVLKTEVKCRIFDICEVKETGRLEIAEVSRIQKKN